MSTDLPSKRCRYFSPGCFWCLQQSWWHAGDLSTVDTACNWVSCCGGARRPGGRGPSRTADVVAGALRSHNELIIACRGNRTPLWALRNLLSGINLVPAWSTLSITRPNGGCVTATLAALFQSWDLPPWSSTRYRCAEFSRTECLIPGWTGGDLLYTCREVGFYTRNFQSNQKGH
jgi:hypothetical protein